MAEYGQSPYEGASQAVSQMGQAAQNIAVASARQKFQQDYMRQQMLLRMQQLQQQQALNAQHSKLYGAQTDLANANAANATAKVNQANQGMQSAGVLGDLVRGMNQYPATTPDLMPLIQGETARAAALGRVHIPENISQVLQMGDPRFQTLLGLGAKTPYQTVGAGATAVPMLPGFNPIRGAVNVPPGNMHLGAQEGVGGVGMPGSGLDMGPQPVTATAPFNPAADSPENKQYGRDIQLFGHLKDPLGEGVDMSNPLAANLYTNLLKQVQGRIPSGNPKMAVPKTGGQTPTIHSKEDFDKLESGATYINGNNGKTFTKP
jgi:hypothetical protein